MLFGSVVKAFDQHSLLDLSLLNMYYFINYLCQHVFVKR